MAPPARRQPTVASQVGPGTTGLGSPGADAPLVAALGSAGADAPVIAALCAPGADAPVITALGPAGAALFFHPSNQRPELRGSIPGAARRCFRWLRST
jgi:hypothetical protein